MNEFDFQTCLAVLCGYVGANYLTTDFDSDDWYNSYEWTKEQETQFFNWMVMFLKTKKSGHIALFIAENQAISFLQQFGWKLKE